MRRVSKKCLTTDQWRCTTFILAERRGNASVVRRNTYIGFQVLVLSVSCSVPLNQSTCEPVRYVKKLPVLTYNAAFQLKMWGLGGDHGRVPSWYHSVVPDHRAKGESTGIRNQTSHGDLVPKIQMTKRRALAVTVVV